MDSTAHTSAHPLGVLSVNAPQGPVYELSPKCDINESLCEMQRLEDSGVARHHDNHSTSRAGSRAEWTVRVDRGKYCNMQQGSSVKPAANILLVTWQHGSLLKPAGFFNLSVNKTAGLTIQFVYLKPYGY